MSFDKGRGGRRAGIVLCLALATAMPVAVHADPGSALAEILARTQATAARMRAQIATVLGTTSSRLSTSLSQTLNRSDATLAMMVQKASDTYVTPTPGTVTEPSAYVMQGGAARRYIVIRPAVATPGAPVLFLLHAHGVSPETMANIARVGRLAAEDGAWIFLPEGVDRDWNSDPANTTGTDDVGFLTQLIQVAVHDRHLDGSHLYFAGYSGGGFMSQRMACESGDHIAGIGVVAATLWSAQVGSCAKTHPMPITEMNGTSDLVVLYNGMFANYQGYLGAPESVAFRALRDGCSATGIQTTTLPNKEAVPSNTVVVLSQFTGCPAGAGARLYTIDNGGHTWPGSQDADYTVALGRTSGDVDATTEIWNFLIGYSLP